MKKFLLFFYDRFIIIKNKVKDLIFALLDFFYVLFHKAPEIMTSEETVNYILKNNCSVTRFGDGEIKLYKGQNISFQTANETFKNEYAEIFKSDDPKLLVCIPRVFSHKQRKPYNKGNKSYWKKHLSYFRKYWYRDLNFNKIYGDAFISRHYMNLENKSSGVKEYFELIKKLWEGRDIIIVEGEKSRLGMGNDLFDTAKSVRRILCPCAQCFDKYDEILTETKKYSTDNLFILSIGPSASILAYDLCKCGYQAIDIGNIDTEYEWFKMGVKTKSPVKNKMVYEAGAGVGVGEADDPKYLSQIIAKIL